MARSTEEITATMDAAQAASPVLSVLNSPSLVAIYTAWKFIIASISNQSEQLYDIKVTKLEAIAAAIPACSDAWLRAQVLLFQYDATAPQVIQIDPITFAPSYPIVDATKRIITRCSVKTASGGQVAVKVAKNEPPEALTVGELAAVDAYLNQNTTSAAVGIVGGIGFVGMQIGVTTASPDRLYVKGTIYYNGQYSQVIAANVIAAIDAYLAAIPFDGVVKVIGLTDAIQNVAGVTDLKLEEVAMRDSGTGWAGRTNMVTGYDLLLNAKETTAGYIISEDTALHTLLDELVFTPS